MCGNTEGEFLRWAPVALHHWRQWKQEQGGEELDGPDAASVAGWMAGFSESERRQAQAAQREDAAS